MSSKKSRFLKEVARYYDSKREDLNLLLARDKIVHHHSGICSSNSKFPKMTEGELLEELHRQEMELTRRGIQYLDKIKPNMRGLDAGCGRGGSSFMIQEKFGCSLDGVSISSYQTEFASKVAQEKGVADRVRFHLGDMLKTPFKDSTFDFIWICESSEHVLDLADMFREFARITKKGGLLLIITWCGNPKHPKGSSYAKRINAAYRTSLHSPEEYSRLAAENGWKMLKNIDLTSETMPYWKLRQNSANKTGTESLMYGAYKCGALQYRLFKYRKD